jgi:hypothetical protein
MSKLSVSQLPAVARGGLVAAYFTSFVCFEEFVIDRHHWNRFLPLYRIGNLCPYDVIAFLVIVSVVCWPARGRIPSAGDRSSAA